MVKALETSYKGYRFRSRLEARWAVFFDALKIAWDYEVEGYDLGNAGAYLPDFVLTVPESARAKNAKSPYASNQRYGWKVGSRIYIEVKGLSPTADEIFKVRCLAMETRQLCYLIVGAPGNASRLWAWPSGKWGGQQRIERSDRSNPAIDNECIWFSYTKSTPRQIIHAINKSRSERFGT